MAISSLSKTDSWTHALETVTTYILPCPPLPPLPLLAASC